MTLGEAIVQAHARRDVAARNRLMRYAREHGATVRDLCALVGLKPATVHVASGGKGIRPRPLEATFTFADARSVFPSGSADSVARVKESDPATAATVRGHGNQERGS